MKDVKNAAIEAGEGSKDFARLTNAASEAKKQMDDLNDAVRALDTGEIGGTIGKLGGAIAGGFQAATGAMALFGVESEEVEKTLLKVQAATALAQGIQSVNDLGKSFKAFGLILQSTAIGQKIVTAAQWLWNAAVTANPIMAMVTALLAAISAIVIFSKNTESAAEKQARLNEELEKTNKQLEHQYDLYVEANENTRLTIQNQINLLKAKGATDKEIYDKEAELIKNSLGLLKWKEGQQEKLSAEEIRLRRKLLNDLEVLEINFNKKQSDRAEAEAKKQREKWLEGQKKLEEEKKKAREKENSLEAEAAQFKIDEQKRKDDEEYQRLVNKLNANIDANEKSNAQLALDEERRIAQEQANWDAKVSIAQSGYQALSALGNIFINDAKKLEQFQKGAALVQIATDTALAISALVRYAQQNPLNGPTGGLAGVATFASGITQILANIAKAKQLLTSRGSSSAPSLGAQPRGGGGRTDASGGVNITPVRSTTSTTIESEKVEQGQSVIRAYVVENDITSKQNAIKNIVMKSKIK
jgi:hypothetical protein